MCAAILSVFFFHLFLSPAILSIAFSGQASYDIPTKIDPEGRYLFFLHNYYVEKKGPDGDCRYNDILKAFSDSGFVVISEVRKGKIIPCQYGSKVAQQINSLLDSGVPSRNITVSGHSKGGVIALCVASELKNEKINYVIMAGCGIAGIQKYKMYPDFSNLKGRILSIYAASDTVAGSCITEFSKAAKGLSHTEVVLESADGHKLFFTPDKIWLSPVTTWINNQY
ncbi:MAG: hypothetical protein HUN04_10105 [Desulfobacter sp.]|nr:MAG: hypothetical protein HUN04_10105 [Desulfobacter sp.]